VESGGCRIPPISYFHPVRVEFRRYFITDLFLWYTLFKCNRYILISSKLRNVSSDPKFEEWVVERYCISIHIYEIFSNQCLLDTLHIG